MTPEERKQMIKELIERIPTAKDDLFAFPIDWKYVDNTLVEQRVIFFWLPEPQMLVLNPVFQSVSVADRLSLFWNPKGRVGAPLTSFFVYIINFALISR